jgi:hypothetical protein
VLCFATAVSAQKTAPTQVAPIHLDAASIAARQALIRNAARFLGWRFVSRYPSASARWQGLNGKIPLVPAGSPSGSNRVHDSPQGGNGGFANPGFALLPGLPTGFIPTAVVQGDFNGDGQMDVAISNGGDNTVYVLLGNGDGTFKVPEILYTQGQSPTWITAVSLRNNGHLDLAVTDGDSQAVEIFLGNGDGTFQRGVSVPVSDVPTFVIAGDFNKDGNPDLAVGLTVEPDATSPQFEILLGNGSGGFSGTVIPPSITNLTDSPWPTGWIASGDINKDGFTDLITTLTGGFAITYLNQAGQAFSQGAEFGPSDGPMVVDLGDMDEDGCLDAVELGGFGYVTIAKGTCDGNFTQAAPVAGLGDIEPAVKVVDVNGDGHLDVVGSAAYYMLSGVGEGREAGYLVSVLKGDGKGNLAPPQVYRGGVDAFSLVVADFTGDNRPEILTVDSYENRATFFLNDGAGNYAAPQGEFIGELQGVINLPNPNVSMQAADLNGDGKPDLILVEDGTFGNLPSTLTVMLNDGTGEFLPPVRSPITVGATVPLPEFAVGAFRSASEPDVVYISKFSNANVVAFFPGNGDGTFGAPTTLATLPNPLQIVTGDFNKDGKLDFVVVGTGETAADWEFDFFFGHGDGTFTELPSQEFPVNNGGSLQQLFALDLNHDGKLDLLMGMNDDTIPPAGDDLVEALGNGDGTFQATTTLIPHFGAVAIADVNHDGFMDLISAQDPNVNLTTFYSVPAVTVYLGTAGGTFVQQPTYHPPGIASPPQNPLLVGDFNGDGNPDIAVQVLPLPLGLGIESELSILQGNGDGTFTITGDVFPLQLLSQPFVGADFNGDGATDLVELVAFTSSFHTIQAAQGPSLVISFDSRPIVVNTGSATVTLDRPAVTSTIVTLAASDPAVQLPLALTFASGQQVQSFPFTVGPAFDNTHLLQLSATLGTEKAVAYAGKANPNAAVGVVASFNSNGVPFQAQTISITPGESFQFGLSLTSLSGYSGTYSSFQCGGLPAGATCTFSPNSIQVPPGGSNGVNFTVATSGSTPYGMFPVQITTTDGFSPASIGFPLGIGTFSLAVAPSLIVVGPSGTVLPTITSSSTNGLNETVGVVCSGLPASARCVEAGNTLFANGGTTTMSVGSQGTASGDYPFQFVGTATIQSQSVGATLRVGDFTATIDHTAATLSAGQSAVFNVTLTSLNHYVSQITVSCQSPVDTVTCLAVPSPAPLSDGGTAVVQLTLSVSAAAAIRPTPRVPLPTARFALLLMVAILILTLRRRRMVVVSLATFLVIAGLISCGGGGGSGAGGGGGGGGGGGSGQTFNVAVVASAASTESDFNNQKNVGPIVLTVQ